MFLLFSALNTQMANGKDVTRFRPDFYKNVQAIHLIDPLSYVLGATEKTEPYIYHYTDIIKFSGHSCPSVAGAYKMTQLALKELYGSQTPIRGHIRVIVKGAPDEKVNGPISQVISIITGAAGITGFKGIKGKFSRFQLMEFDTSSVLPEEIWARAVFERIDNGKKVDVTYKLNLVPNEPRIAQLMPLILSGKATPDQEIEFGDLWQKRVRTVLLEPPQGVFVVKPLN